MQNYEAEDRLVIARGEEFEEGLTTRKFPVLHPDYGGGHMNLRRY